MNAEVDAEKCIGCGLCADNCPAVFEMDDALAKVLVETVPEDSIAACKEAATNCPVEAIILEE